MAEQGRVLGLDLGDARIGVAVSDGERRVALPLGTIRTGAPDDLRAVTELVREHGVSLVVVGHPLLMSGDAGARAHLAERFAEGLRAALEIPVVLQDERLSTVQADRALRGAGARGRSRRRAVDRSAAAVILQAWLDAAGRDRSPASAGEPTTAAGRAAGPMQAPQPADDLVPLRRGHRVRREANWGLRIALVLVVLVTGLAYAGKRYYDWCQGASGPQTPVAFEVEEGASGNAIVDALHEQGVVRCGTITRWLLRRSGLESEFRAGSFELTTNMTPDEAFQVLTTPEEPVPTVRLTVPEGFRVTQTAERVEEDLGIPASRFLKVAANGDWSLPPYLPPDAESIEGFLFPETYEFIEGRNKPKAVIRRLLEQFELEAETLPWEKAEELGVTPYEVVIVASMIEEEAKLEEERALIAGVIYNRLREGMVLGIDATLLYDDPTPDGQLSFSDLEYDSPYNTRINGGLPPTPIASPGRASLEAALNPRETEFFYYVLCGADGRHEFGVTQADHEANRIKCDE